MKRKLLSTVLSCTLLLTSLAGCSQTSNSGQTSAAVNLGESNSELTFVNYRDIRDLNPHLYAGEMYAQSILYDTLVSITEDGYVGCLAERLDHQRGWPHLHIQYPGQCRLSPMGHCVMPMPFWPTSTPSSKTRSGTPGWR